MNKKFMILGILQMKLKISILFIIFFTGFSKFLTAQESFKENGFTDKKIIENTCNHWTNFINNAALQYNVDNKLIKSIIYVESSGNPFAKSRSNAIGLMQIKPASAGLEVYRLQGKKGQPSIKELYDPKININIGTAYINCLQKKYLLGIKNKEIMKYATILSYVNGPSALLKTFSQNTRKAISIINTMTIKSFFEYVKKNIHQNKRLII